MDETQRHWNTVLSQAIKELNDAADGLNEYLRTAEDGQSALKLVIPVFSAIGYVSGTMKVVCRELSGEWPDEKESGS